MSQKAVKRLRQENNEWRALYTDLHEVFRKAVNVKLNGEEVEVTFADPKEFQDWLNERIKQQANSK